MSDSTSTDRTMTWWPIVGAAVIAVVVAAVILLVGGSDRRPGTARDSSGALTCPSAYNPDGAKQVWVPAIASGVDGRSHLVPDATPSHVTICRYAQAPSTLRDVKLTGHRTLQSGRSALTKELSALPERGAGAHSSQPVGTPYLLAVTFDTGYVWIAAPAPQLGMGNGQFTTNGEVNDRIAEAYRTGAWPTS